MISTTTRAGGIPVLLGLGTADTPFVVRRTPAGFPTGDSRQTSPATHAGHIPERQRPSPTSGGRTPHTYHVWKQGAVPVVGAPRHRGCRGAGPRPGGCCGRSRAGDGGIGWKTAESAVSLKRSPWWDSSMGAPSSSEYVASS